MSSDTMTFREVCDWFKRLIQAEIVRDQSDDPSGDKADALWESFMEDVQKRPVSVNPSHCEDIIQKAIEEEVKKQFCKSSAALPTPLVATKVSKVRGNHIVDDDDEDYRRWSRIKGGIHRLRAGMTVRHYKTHRQYIIASTADESPILVDSCIMENPSEWEILK
jgi:hypothetical protein